MDLLFENLFLKDRGSSSIEYPVVIVDPFHNPTHSSGMCST
jgi:hypothetical protein